MDSNFGSWVGKMQVVWALSLALLFTGGATGSAGANVVAEAGAWQGRDAAVARPCTLGSASRQTVVADTGVASPAMSGMVIADADISDNVMQIMTKVVSSDRAIKLAYDLLNEKLRPYGLNAGSLPQDVLDKYLDATANVRLGIIEDIACQAARLEAQGASQAQLEEFIAGFLPKLYGAQIGAVVQALARDGVIGQSQGAASVPKTAKTTVADDMKIVSDKELEAEFKGEYFSARIEKIVEKMSELDGYRALLFKKVIDGLGVYGLTMEDIPGETRSKAVQETCMLYKRNHLRMVAEGSKLEASGADQQAIAEYLHGAMVKTMSVWGDATLRWLIDSGAVDEAVRRKGGNSK